MAKKSIDVRRHGTDLVLATGEDCAACPVRVPASFRIVKVLRSRQADENQGPSWLL